MRRSQNWLLGAVGVVLLVNLGVGAVLYAREAEERGENQVFEKVSIMMRVLHLIRQDYVDAERVEPETLIYNAMRGMVGALDPFSSFLDPEQYERMRESTEGQFGGFGVVVTMRNNVLTVVTPLEGTPGSKAGLRAGDRIVAIDGETTQGMTLQEAVQRMKGEPGTEAEFTIVRQGADAPLTKTIERAIIEVPTVKNVTTLEGDIGYLRITQFNEPTSDLMRDAVDSLGDKKIRGLIVDVRNNPGGLLESAVEVADLFLPSNKLVVSTEGRRPSQKQKFYTHKPARLPDIPVAVLANEGSASAAEILAGCLQDWKRAIMIGEQTFGKGSVQNVIALPDGSALRLTTAMYYTPSRRVIHENGLKPGIRVPLTEEEQDQVLKWQHDVARQQKGEIFIDPQIQRALDVLQSYDSFTEARNSQYKELRQPPQEGEETSRQVRPPETSP